MVIQKLKTVDLNFIYFRKRRKIAVCKRRICHIQIVKHFLCRIALHPYSTCHLVCIPTNLKGVAILRMLLNDKYNKANYLGII